MKSAVVFTIKLEGSNARKPKVTKQCCAMKPKKGRGSYVRSKKVEF